MEAIETHGFFAESRGVVRFNDEIFWMPEFRALLDAMAEPMPEVAGHALDLREKRKASKRGRRIPTARSFVCSAAA